MAFRHFHDVAARMKEISIQKSGIQFV